MRVDELPISQSLMNDVFDNPCPKKIYYRWIQKIPVEPSEVMKRGHYFEWLVLGGSTSDMPQLEKLKSGAKSQAEKDLDELAGVAKKTIELLGIDLSKAKVQQRLESDGLSGVIDMVANDIEEPSRRAIYDLKYTETRYDDRFNGWADIESRMGSKRQAKHYIHLWHKIYGEYLPYYFLIFGKSGWCRIIKCVLTNDSLEIHLKDIDVVRAMMYNWDKADWPANPVYEKCKDCPYASVCDSWKFTPEIEVAII